MDFIEVHSGNFFVKGGAAGWAITGGGADAGVGDTDHGAPVFDFQAWLGQSVQTGLVKGAHLLHPIEEEPS